MNKLWHEKHPVPGKATVEERAQRHFVHAKACGCREIPAGLKGGTEVPNLNIPPP